MGLLVGLLLLLYALGPRILESWRQTALVLLGAEELARSDIRQLPQTLREVGTSLAGAITLFLLGVVCIAVIVNLAQVGFLFAPRKLTPRADALNPLRGFGRIFGSSRSYVALLMNLGKMGLAGAVAWFAIENELPRLLGLAEVDFAPGVTLAATIVFSIGIKIAVVLLLLAMADYAYQRYSHEQQLKMTRQQVKEEMRSMEGDPQIKIRRRQMVVQRALQRIKSDVPSADIVLTSQTFYAVAIKYDQSSMRAPLVVARGAGLVAVRIRELASTHGVPIVERAPLAKAVCVTVEVGHEIPEDFDSAIAELLAYAYQLDRPTAAAGVC